jgi:hypothetical protein
MHNALFWSKNSAHSNMWNTQYLGKTDSKGPDHNRRKGKMSENDTQYLHLSNTTFHIPSQLLCVYIYMSSSKKLSSHKT